MASIPIIPSNPGTVSGIPSVAVPTSFLPGTFVVQQTNGSTNLAPCVQVCAGATDAVTFANAVNLAIFTSTGPDAATLATPGSGDVGKILVLVNTNTTQNVVTTAANKITSGATSAGDTLTAPAHSGAAAVLIAYNGFWSLVVGGTGSWVLSEV